MNPLNDSVRHRTGLLLWLLLLPLLLLRPAPLRAASPAPRYTAADNLADFDALTANLAQRYIYFDRKRTNLDQLRQRLRPQAAAARNRAELIRVLEQVLEPLADGHATLNTNLPESTRLIPSGLDVWAELQKGQAIVTQVRRDWPAAQAGVRPGDVITAINGLELQAALTRRLPCCCDAEAASTRQWTLLALLAGTHSGARRLTLQTSKGVRQAELANPDELPAPAAVTAQQLKDDIGYIAVRALGDDASVGAFDRALAELRTSRALILDLRETAAGGSTTVAEPILGRLVRKRQPYQRIVPLSGKPWLREVTPRGPFSYDGPVAVLVGRWTGSMGEGMAIGLDGMRRATIIGSRMAGLLGAVYTYTLPRSGIRYNLPGDRLTHLNGTPREDFVPPVLVEDTGDGDPALTRALAILSAK